MWKSLIAAMVAFGVCVSIAQAQTAQETTRDSAASAGGNPGTVGGGTSLAHRSELDKKIPKAAKQSDPANGAPEEGAAESGGR